MKDWPKSAKPEKTTNWPAGQPARSSVFTLKGIPTVKTSASKKGA